MAAGAWTLTARECALSMYILIERQLSMTNCIYCRCELPSVVPKEHVIPQKFGKFKPDMTLTCVCEECNH